MNYFRKLGERLNDYLYDSSIYVKDRTFVLFSSSQLIALFLSMFTGIFLREPLVSTLVSLAVTAACTVLLIYAVKYHKVASARTIVAVLIVFFFLPFMFFTKGGLDCGAPMTLLLGTYYLVLVLDGKFRIVMCCTSLVINISCWIISYFKPETVISYSREADYIYSLVKFIITGSVLTVLIMFQTKIYQKEARAAEEKSKELEEMNKTQNRFFSSMSHEIRTPINTVLGLNEIILRQEDASEEIRKDARNIQGAGKMLLALINDILDVSKIEAGKMDIVPVNYNVSSMMSEIVNMIWLKAEEKGLKFHVDIDPNVPEMLFGDEVRIKQILINLLNNAVKYTQKGSVSLHVECEFPESDRALLQINVSDTGMGIKPESLPHLFDSFQRVDEEKNRHIEGTGLGLSIVKQLVELMDGEITVNSVYGEGSVFAVTLKQGISSDKRIGDINVGNAGRSTGEKFEHSFTAPEARILIVDDNEMNLQVEQKLLDGTQMTIDLAISGAEALSRTLQYRYDVIFMDHLMPEMDGIDCFERIRQQNGGLNRTTPVIVLTANAGGENVELYNNTGFNGYLVKPVSGRQLEDTLIEHLPPEKVIRKDDGEGKGSQISTASGYIRKKPVVIATSTMSDLPQQVVKDLQIAIIPYTVITNEGVFYDNLDMDSEELVRYMADKTKMVESEPPTEEALSLFFSRELKKAHHLIYITLTTGSSREYGRAMNVAKSFDNVTVINSENLSSGTGILTMIAARLAGQGFPVDRIVSELEEAKGFIRTSFAISSTDIMVRRGRISPFMNNVLNTLWLRPILRMKDDNLGVGKLIMGSEQKCFEKYIKYALPANTAVDKSFVFITYAGMSEDELMWVQEKVLERVKFEHVIFQKASAGISSNCGGGTFGLLYLISGNRNYHLGSYFVEEDEGTAQEDWTDEEAEPAGEPKWYETIPGIDPKAAINNSGSEDAFLTVIKIYYDTCGAKSAEIQGFYDAEDWENYTIKVHALKSSSRLVGALELGSAAEALEMAGKNSDIDYITAHHDSMMAAYKAITDELDPVFGATDDLPEIPADMLADAYAGLNEFVQAQDYELVRMVLDSVKEYKLPDADADRFKRIQDKLSQMDWDGIKEVVDEVNS